MKLESVKPFVVLVCICIVVAALLGFTNGLTAPVIAHNNELAAQKTRMAVLPGAQDFEAVECDTESLGIDSAYKETSGLGYVITASSRGYSSMVTVTVGIGNDGTVVGLSANVSKEKGTIGSRAGKSDYTGKYVGISGSADGIDTLTGATYSSKAVRKSVNAALSAFESIGGAGK